MNRCSPQLYLTAKNKSWGKDDFLFHVTNAWPRLTLVNVSSAERQRRYSLFEYEGKATQLVLTSAKCNAWDREHGQLRFYRVLQNTGVITMGSLCCRRAIIQALFARTEPQRAVRSVVVILSDAGLACDETGTHGGRLGRGGGVHRGCHDPQSSYYLLIRGRRR